MTESITSSGELRQFASENSGRRKIDVQASLDLHRRAANQIDLLGEHLADLQQRLSVATSATTEAAGPAPSPVLEAVPAPAPVAREGDHSQAALMVLQRAQTTADSVIAEAEQIRADAERTRSEADAIARAKADAALAEARGQAAHIIEAAQQRANEVADATAIVADRAAFSQRQYRDKTSVLRTDAEQLVEMAERMEQVAGADLPPTISQPPFTAPLEAPAAPVAAAAVIVEEVVDTAPDPVIAEPALDPVEVIVPGEVEAIAEPAAVLPPPPAAADVDDAAAVIDLTEPEAAPERDLAQPPPPEATLLPPPPADYEPGTDPQTDFLPPPPEAAPAKDVLDLTESELEQVLDGKSIDDELFDDDVVIDLTDDAPAAAAAEGFEFFSRD